MAERKFFVGGNWKMNGTSSSIDVILKFLKDGPLSQESGNACMLPVQVLGGHGVRRVKSGLPISYSSHVTAGVENNYYTSQYSF